MKFTEILFVQVFGHMKFIEQRSQSGIESSALSPENFLQCLEYAAFAVCLLWMLLLLQCVCMNIESMLKR